VEIPPRPPGIERTFTGITPLPQPESHIRLPAKWIFATAGAFLFLVVVAFSAFPTLRHSFKTGWEVRALLRFRERFDPAQLAETCPEYPAYRAAQCAHDRIRTEDRLRFASMTGRIYYLSTIVGVAENAHVAGKSIQDQVEARLDLLTYLNEEMKELLLRTNGEVDLSALDTRAQVGIVEDPEVALTRQYRANVVDLWIKHWRRGQKFLADSWPAIDFRTRSRAEVLQADRDELFSRFEIDRSRYERRRLPAGAPAK
jgi:hypothetical protein